MRKGRGKAHGKAINREHFLERETKGGKKSSCAYKWKEGKNQRSDHKHRKKEALQSRVKLGRGKG